MKGILITAVGNIGTGSQVLEALRLTHINYLIVGTDVLEQNIMYEKLDCFYKVPLASSDQYINKLKQIIIKHNVKLVFVCSYSETKVLQEKKKEFDELDVRFLLPSKEILELCMDKANLFDYLTNKSIVLPKYKRITCVEDLNDIDYFPVVVKQNKDAFASNHVYVAFDEHELRCITDYLLHQEIDIIAQEWIGDSKNEYSVSVTTNEHGSIIGSVAMQRNYESALSYKTRYKRNGKEYIISSGMTQGIIVHNKSLLSYAENIATVLNSIGSLNLQGVWKNDVFYLIDAHPAITSSVYMKALSGYNEPLFYVKKYLDNEEISLDYAEMKIIKKVVAEVVNL